MSKVILMGEHAVVYGYRAIAIPFNNKKVYVNIRKSKIDFKTRDKHLDFLVNLVCNKLNKSRKIKISIINEIPRSKGLGSSASFSISIITALYNYYNQKLTPETLYKLSKEYEDRIHLPSSGLDIFTCIYKTPIIFKKGIAPQKINFHLDLSLVIMDSGIKGKTKYAVSKVKDNENNTEILSKISYQTEKFIENIQKEKSKKRDIELGNIFNVTNNLLDRLGLVVPKSQEIIDLCYENNVLGVKISGSGLGGIVIALVEKDKTKELVNKCRQNKIKIIGIENI